MSHSHARTIRLPLLLVATAALTGNASTKHDATLITPRFQTLLANDPFRHSLSLATGAHGTAIQSHALVNVDSELNFGVFLAGGLTAGIQGSEIGTVLDLGSEDQVATKYGFQETLGGGQGFASIHFEGARLMIRKDLAAQTFQSFTEGNDLLHAPVPQGSVGVPAIAGHLYLIRIVKPSGELVRFAKLLVTSVDTDRVELTFLELQPMG